MDSQIALQLYSVRAELDKDYEKTIERIASYGYTGVEPAGCAIGLSFCQCAKIIKKAGLKIPSAFVPLVAEANRSMVFDNIKELGADYIVVGKGRNDFNTVDKVKRCCDQFNSALALAKQKGLKLAIHNHWVEFEDIDGVPVYKIMLENLSEEVLFELDTYWIKVAGKDPAQILEELASRTPLIHIKDGSGVPLDFNMKAVGSGIMDFKPIFAHAQQAEWLVCELDACETDMLTAVRESFDYIKANK